MPSMVRELSLCILDLGENSIKSSATRISIKIEADTQNDFLLVSVADNGIGMTDEQIENAADPFFGTLHFGLPFASMLCDICGGKFGIESGRNGTRVTMSYRLSSVDLPPMGDLAQSVITLLLGDPRLALELYYKANGREFTLETGDYGDKTSFGVLREIREFIKDNIKILMEDKPYEEFSGIARNSQ